MRRSVRAGRKGHFSKRLPLQVTPESLLARRHSLTSLDLDSPPSVSPEWFSEQGRVSSTGYPSEIPFKHKPFQRAFRT